MGRAVGAPEIRVNGRVMVTMSEFAAREGISQPAVSGLVKKGTLSVRDVNGYRARYMDWETEHQKYQVHRTKYSGIKPKPFMPADPGTAPPSERLPEVREPAVSEPAGGDVRDLSNIDPMEYPQCWIRGTDGQPLTVPETGKPMLDYDMLKLLLTGESYKQKLDIERGRYVDRDTLVRTALSVAGIVRKALDSIPQRYAATLMAEAEVMAGRSFTPGERSVLMNALKDEGPLIMGSVQAEIMRLTEEHDG